jgi:hypothetical protein
MIAKGASRVRRLKTSRYDRLVRTSFIGVRREGFIRLEVQIALDGVGMNRLIQYGLPGGA